MGAWSSFWRLLKDKQFQWLWFVVLYTVSIICTFTMALGCLSGPTARNYLYRVNVTDVATTLASRTGKDPDDFLHQDLPRLWIWGYSGVCFKNDTGGVLSCEYGFPPTFTADHILNRFLNPGSDEDARIVIDNWDEVYSNGTLSLKSNRGAFLSASRGAAALLVLSLVIAFVNLAMALVDPLLETNFFRRWSLSLAMLDLAFLFAGFSLTTVARYKNELAVGANFEAADWGHLGPAFPVVATGMFLKLMVLPFVGPVFFFLATLFLIWVLNSLCSGEVDEDD